MQHMAQHAPRKDMTTGVSGSSVPLSVVLLTATWLLLGGLCTWVDGHTHVVRVVSMGGTSRASLPRVGLPRKASPAAKSHSSDQSGRADTLAVRARARLTVPEKNGRSAWSLVCMRHVCHGAVQCGRAPAPPTPRIAPPRGTPQSTSLSWPCRIRAR